MIHNPLLQGKNIIFINSGSKKKAFTLEKAKKLGLNIILVNRKMDAKKNLISHFIQADTYNSSEVVEKLKLFQKKHPNVPFDGAITFWEDDVPLHARVCTEFGLIGNSYDAAVKTRNKHEMRKRFKETGLGSPQFALVKTQHDLEKAIDRIGFPAVLKPAWGSDSEFVIYVKNREEAEKTLDYLVKNCTEEFNPIFKFNDHSFLYEEYMDGMEISLEAFSQYGIPNVVGIHEKQPIRLPYFVEYGDIAPARLDDETAAAAVKLAESAMIALGVTDSLAHIEAKITKEGPKLVEVASRMGGDDIYMNVKHIWDTDLVEVGLEVALGIKSGYKKTPPKDCAICRYFIPDESGILTQIEDAKETEKVRGVLDIIINKNVGDAVLVPPEGFENVGWGIVKGRTYQEAETIMNKVMEDVKINVTPFHRDSLLGRTEKEDALKKAYYTRKQIIRASHLAKIQSVNFEALKKLNIALVENSLNPKPKTKEALKEMGYNLKYYNFDDAAATLKNILKDNIDFVFNVFSESDQSSTLKSHVAAFCESLQIPYIGSSSATLSLAADKLKVKKLLDFHEIPTPAWDYVDDLNEELTEELEYPLIVKPVDTDYSMGITNESVVTNEKALKRQIEYIVKGLKRPALIEEYIEGDEYDMCLLGNTGDVQILPKLHSNFKKMPPAAWHIYSSERPWEETMKYVQVGKSGKINRKLDVLMNEISLDIFNIFSCKDYAKIEIRVDKEGNPYVLELNPNPDIEMDSFMYLAAKLGDYTYPEFLEEIFYVALQRYKDYAPFSHLHHSKKKGNR